MCIWGHHVTGAEWYVGVFYLVSGVTYKCRSAANIGVLSVGQTNKAVSLTIQSDDFIGSFERW